MGKITSRIVDRYFIYRDQYVAYFREQRPSRVGWAIASEVARLAFVATGAALFSGVLVLLTIGAVEAPGRRWWAIPFALLSFWAVGSLIISSRSLIYAVGVLRTHRQDC